MAQQTGSYDMGATKKSHDDAEKVATNYVTDITNGIMVHPEGDATTGWKISDALELLKSGITYIKAWLAGTNNDTPTVQIGRDDAGHSIIDSNGMRIYGGSGTNLLATIGYGESVGQTGATGEAPYFTFGSRVANSAIGAYSQTQGVSHEASGYASHAEGFGCSAIGNYSHAEGNLSVASGAHAHAEGYGTDAHGAYSHAEGSATEAIGLYSHAEGDASVANGAYSHVEGGATTGASANYSHAENGGTANGPYSHAENLGTANGSHSHAEGSSTANTTTSADYAHAEGGGTASDEYAHAEGQATTASGKRAHAEGLDTTAGGYNSHAQNKGTKASSDNQTAIGAYNVEDANDKFALIIGNGTADSARSNAFTVGWSGDIESASDITSGGNVTSAGDVNAGGDVADGAGNTLAGLADLLTSCLLYRAKQVVSSSITIAARSASNNLTINADHIDGYIPVFVSPRNTGNPSLHFRYCYLQTSGTNRNGQIVVALGNPSANSVTISSAYVNVLYAREEMVG